MRRLRLQPAAEEVAGDAAASAFSPAFAPVSRNLMNYPIARDARFKVKWLRGTKTGDWYCRLLGRGDRLLLRLPAATAAASLRCPSGFDMNVLYWVLAAAAIKHTSTLEIPAAAIIKGLGLSVQTTNRQRLEAALKLWSSLRILHGVWHYPGEREARPISLPPPIRSRSSGPRLVRIVINEAWLKLKQGFYEQVPLPLPMQATTQNLVLLLLTAYVKKTGAMEIIAPRRIDAICESLGLHHSTRGRALVDAVEGAKKWLRENGGVLEYTKIDPTISFALKRPRIAKARAQDTLLRKGQKLRPTISKQRGPWDRDVARIKDLLKPSAPNPNAGKTRVFNDAGEAVYLSDDELEEFMERRYAN